MSAPLRVEVAGGVAALTFDRPQRYNALTVETVELATRAVERAAADPAVRVVTLTGAGKAFCSGADLGGAAAGVDSPDVDPGDVDVSLLEAANRLVLAIRAAPQLVVALVNGPAVGVGGSLALACDLAFASDAAYLKAGFEAIGLIPDGGGTALLAASLGRSRTMAFAVLGDRIDAAEGERVGLFARTWPAAQFADRARAAVESLARGPAPAFAALKRAVDARTLPGLATALETERREQRVLLASADFAEGVRAFREKRPARFGAR